MEYRLKNLDHCIKSLTVNSDEISIGPFIDDCVGVIHQIQGKYRSLMLELESSNKRDTEEYKKLMNIVKHYDRMINHIYQTTFVG